MAKKKKKKNSKIKKNGNVGGKAGNIIAALLKIS